MVSDLTRSRWMNSRKDGKRRMGVVNSMGWAYGAPSTVWFKKKAFYIIYAKGAGPSLDDGMALGTQGLYTRLF